MFHGISCPCKLIKYVDFCLRCFQDPVMKDYSTLHVCHPYTTKHLVIEFFGSLSQEINRLNEENTKLRDRIKILEGKVRE